MTGLPPCWKLPAWTARYYQTFTNRLMLLERCSIRFLMRLVWLLALQRSLVVEMAAVLQPELVLCEKVLLITTWGPLPGLQSPVRHRSMILRCGLSLGLI